LSLASSYQSIPNPARDPNLRVIMSEELLENIEYLRGYTSCVQFILQKESLGMAVAFI
jgi:hypothetical protein